MCAPVRFCRELLGFDVEREASWFRLRVQHARPFWHTLPGSWRGVADAWERDASLDARRVCMHARPRTFAYTPQHVHTAAAHTGVAHKRTLACGSCAAALADAVVLPDVHEDDVGVFRLRRGDEGRQRVEQPFVQP